MAFSFCCRPLQKKDRYCFEILEREFLSTIYFLLPPLMAPHINFSKKKHPGTPSPTQPALVGKGYIFKANICRILSFHWFQRHQEDLFVASSEAPSLATSSDKVEAEACGSSEQNSDQLLVVGRFFERSLLYNSLRQTHKNHVHVFFGVSFLIFVIVTVKSFESMCHQHLPIIYQPHQVSPNTFRLMKECRFLFPSGPTNHRRRHVCRTWAALLWVGKVAGSIGHEGLEEISWAPGWCRSHGNGSVG